MKIDHISQPTQTAVATSLASGKGADVSFSRLISQALNQEAGAPQVDNANMLHHDPLQGTLQMAMPGLAPALKANLPKIVLSADSIQAQGLNHADNLLACLENYQSLLGDPKASFKEVYKSLELMEDEVRQTAPLMDKLGASDPLLDVLQSVSSLAMVESVKFRRGDYLE